MNDNRKGAAGTGARARELASVWVMRSLAIAFSLAVALVVLVALTLPGDRKPQESVQPKRTSRELSQNMNRKQLLDAIKASEAAFKLYIKNDRMFGDFKLIAREFETMSSDSDLLLFLETLGSAAGDDYFTVMTTQRYEHITALQAGAKVGVDFDFTWDSQKTAWRITKVGPVAEAAGLRKDDHIHSINGEVAVPTDDSDMRSINEEKLKAAVRGLLNSQIEVVVKRGEKLAICRLRVGVLSVTEPFKFEVMEHPFDKDRKKEFRAITFNHLHSPSVVTEFYLQLKQCQDENVKGIAIDLRALWNGDGETATRIAAMFRGKGVVSRVIATTPDGHLLMKTYEIIDGKLHLKTQGPFQVGENGKLVTTPLSKDTDEVKDWPVDVYKGPVVAVVGRDTSGVGELIATSFKESWNVEKRGYVVSKVYTWGKGTGQTIFPIGEGYVLVLSTSFYLQPDGQPIEGRLGPGPNGACPQKTDEWWFARYTLIERLNVVPRPEWPGAGK